MSYGKNEISTVLKLMFVIQCHKISNALEFTVSKLKCIDNVTVFIHVDAKSDISKFIHLESRNVKLIKDNRVNINWGGGSQILLYIKVFEMISFIDYDYVSFISGDDLLVKDIETFRHFLRQHNGKEFIGVQNVSSKRFEHRYKFIYPGFMFQKELSNINKLLRRIFYLATDFGFFKNKRHCKYNDFYKGSNWFTITKKASVYLFSTLKENKELIDFFDKSYCCDEIFFHTILMNSSEFKFNVFKYDYPWIDDNLKSLRYIDWLSGPTYPRVFSAPCLLDINIPKFVFFCRKIEPNLTVEELSCLFDKMNRI
ncbi:beta-1,6-N-acetylglucosaminyltransferase [Aeromonas salmonicida]